MGPLVRPAGNTVAEARQLSAVGFYNPYVNDYFAWRESNVGSDVEENVPESEPMGRKLFTMPPGTNSNYRLLDIRPVGSLIVPNSADFPTVSDINGANQGFIRWTPCRARLYWMEQGTTTQEIDVDIGKGVTFTAPPNVQVECDLLVPKDTTTESIQIGPDTFTREIPVPPQWNNDAIPKFGSTVACKATYVTSPAASRATFSLTYFIGGDDIQDSIRQVNIPRGARAVKIRAIGVGKVLATGDVVAVFNNEFAPTIPGAPLAPGVSFPGMPAQRVVFINPNETDLTPIPQPYNVINLAWTIGPPSGAIVTLTFVLDV